MRLNYTENPPTNLTGEDAEILKRVQDRRRAMGLPLIPLDLTLLHAPRIADGWNSLMGIIRGRTSLPDDVREIAMCRPALINCAWIEWIAHAPILLESEGFTAAKLAVVQQLHPADQGSLSDRQWAVLRYADAMTREVAVPQALFDEVKEAGFNDQQMVELTATVAGYNFVTRFLVALDIGENNAQAPDWAK